MAKRLRADAARALRERFSRLPVPEKKSVDRFEAARLLGKELNVVKKAIKRGDVLVVKRGRAGAAARSGDRFVLIPKAEFLKLRRQYANYLTVPEALPIFEKGVGGDFSCNVVNLRHLIQQHGLRSKGDRWTKIHIKDLLRLIHFARRALEGETMHQMAKKMGLPYATLYSRVRKFLPEINASVLEYNNQLYLPQESVEKLWALHRNEAAKLTVLQVQLQLVKNGLYLERSTILKYFHSGKLSGQKSKMDNRRFLFDPESVKTYIRTQLQKKKKKRDILIVERAGHTKVKKPRRYSKRWRAKEADAENVKAWAVRVSEQFWPTYKELFMEKHAMQLSDLVQECTEEFYKVSHKYNPEYALSTFAYGVMKNRLRNIITLAKVKKRSGRRFQLSQAEDAKKLEDVLEDKSRRVGKTRASERRNREAIEEIKRSLKKVGLTPLELRRLTMLIVDGKSREQIALEEGIRKDAVYESIRIAIKKLRENPRITALAKERGKKT